MKNNCRFCKSELKVTFADLGMSPVSNAFVPEERRQAMEPFYPLHAYVCEKCYLVQLMDFESPESHFNDQYAYFSSFSDSWLKHCEAYTQQMIDRFKFGSSSQVVELASNDGYLLQYFKARGVPVLGVEPTRNTAEVAMKKGIPTEMKFFGRKTAEELLAAGKGADLLLGNNVLAHVPDINDFVGGMKILLKKNGVITMEFPHLLRLMKENQFDTIYHEHFSYLSFLSVQKIFAHHGITLFDVEELPTHGGSLRIYGRHTENASLEVQDRVMRLLEAEKKAGLDRMETYTGFQKQVEETKRAVLEFLIQEKRKGKKIVGYGAPAKGNTLLNYCGVREDFIDYTVDRSPRKQGTYLPGVHIPVYAPEKIRETKPDYLFILPWNLKDEVMQSMSFIREWGGKFVVPIPKITVYS